MAYQEMYTFTAKDLELLTTAVELIKEIKEMCNSIPDLDDKEKKDFQIKIKELSQLIN